MADSFPRLEESGCKWVMVMMKGMGKTGVVVY